MEFTKIVDNLYLGSYNDIIKEYYKKVKTDVIINVAEECKIMLTSEDNIGYYHYSYYDRPSEDISKTFDEIVDLIDKYIKMDKTVFIHCYAGKSRSVSFVLVYLMKYREFDLQTAYNYVDEMRQIYPNLGFINQLMKYEVELTKKSTLDYDLVCIDYIYNTVGFVSMDDIKKIYYESNKDVDLTMDKIFESR